MPKKAKKTDKKGKGKKGGKDEGEKEAEKKLFEAPDNTNKEVELQKELDELDLELGSLKKQVKDLREENDWLQEEAEKTKMESQDYQTYVSRKAKKREVLVTSLTEHHQQELKEIEAQKELLIKNYGEKKTNLSMLLLEKEQELSKVQVELEKLQPFKVFEQQVRQEQEISSLERQLEEAVFHHENHVRRMKTQFLQERRAYDAEMAARVRLMTQRADQQASECLEEYTAKIRSENKRLRAELKQLIETTNDLQLQRKRLTRQYNSLLREHQLNHDLQRLRGSVYGISQERDASSGGLRTLPDIRGT